MNPKLLDLVPKRYLCPACGSWHFWCHLSTSLNNCSKNPVCLSNSLAIPSACSARNLKVSVSENDFILKTDMLCKYSDIKLDAHIPIDSVQEDSNNSRILFSIKHHLHKENEISYKECDGCDFTGKCNILRLHSKNPNRNYIEIPLGFEFDKSEFLEATKDSESASNEENEHCIQDYFKAAAL